MSGLTRMAVRALGGVGVVLGAVGCAELLGPEVPEAAEPLLALPAEYEGWWEMVERCSGLQGDLDSVRWYVFPDGEPFPDGEFVAGRYYSLGHQIVLVAGGERDGHLVRHEMLHALMAVARLTGHPRTFFGDRCGGLVRCTGECATEVRSTAPSTNTAATIDPDDAVVTVRLVPPVVSLSAGTAGCVTIVVTVRNVLDESVVMDVRSPTSFSWRVQGIGRGSGGGGVPPDRFLLLRPGEAREYAYDCPRDLRSLTPGSYSVRGAFERKQSDPVTLTIVP